MTKPATTKLEGATYGPQGDGKPGHLVILLHGYGADGNDLIGLAPVLAPLMPDVVFHAPNAPYPCEGNPFGYQWFGISRLDPALTLAGVRSAAPLIDAFLDANEGTSLVQAMFREEPAPDADTATLTSYGRKVRKRFQDWWAKGDTAAGKSLPTYYGPQTLHELLERTTWHCGQHVRQYMMLLEKEGVSHHTPLMPADFVKLPMPQNVWDG